MAVYVVHPQDNAKYVKIGYSSDTDRRITNLQIAHPSILVTPLLFETAGEEFETYLHILFEEFRERGEWFLYTGSLKDLFIAMQTVKMQELWLDWFNLIDNRVRLHILNNVFRKDELEFLHFWLVLGTEPQKDAIHQLVRGFGASNKKESTWGG